MRLCPLAFEDLPGWSPDELTAVWPVYIESCKAIVARRQPLRIGVDPSAEMTALARRALELPPASGAVSDYFRENFRALQVRTADNGSDGFVTGYYEPEIDGAFAPSSEFQAPILARPDDLVDMRGRRMPDWDERYESARRNARGDLEPYPTRAQIEAGAVDVATRPIVWLRDHVEVFFAQVQGSARIVLPDGSRKRLVYAGRNGRPYTSIGRILIARGDVPEDEMSLARCKAWLRAHGLEAGEPGRALLQENESYVFFRLEEEADPAVGPIGGQGLPLTPLRSLAVDRTIWPYGSLVWIGADLSSAGLGEAQTGRLMVAQDTGSAIVGPARGDIFVGSGGRAGEIAGLIRHSARFFVLAPAGLGRNGRD